MFARLVIGCSKYGNVVWLGEWIYFSLRGYWIRWKYLASVANKPEFDLLTSGLLRFAATCRVCRQACVILTYKVNLGAGNHFTPRLFIQVFGACWQVKKPIIPLVEPMKFNLGAFSLICIVSWSENFELIGDLGIILKMTAFASLRWPIKVMELWQAADLNISISSTSKADFVCQLVSLTARGELNRGEKSCGQN